MELYACKLPNGCRCEENKVTWALQTGSGHLATPPPGLQMYHGHVHVGRVGMPQPIYIGYANVFYVHLHGVIQTTYRHSMEVVH